MSYTDPDKITEVERSFLEEKECCKNKHGVYLFISANGHERISLDYFLHEYKEWLIENKIVKPNK